MAWDIVMVGNIEGEHFSLNNIEIDELKSFDLLEGRFKVNSQLEFKCPNSSLGNDLHNNNVLKIKVY